MKKTIKIEGMSCGHCVAAVTEELKQIEGIESVVVTLEAKNAIVEMNTQVDNALLKAAVEEAGYTVTGIE